MKNVILFLFLVSSLGCYSQNKSNDTIIYEFVEVSAEFPGGMNELYTFLSQNIHYPQECIDNSIQGKVYVKFAVMKDGSIKDITIIKGAHQLLNEEAIRVIGLMPNWKPGTQKGKPVNVYFTLPINFTIDQKIQKKVVIED
jgi:periplasmic protein TonB